MRRHRLLAVALAVGLVLTAVAPASAATPAGDDRYFDALVDADPVSWVTDAVIEVVAIRGAVQQTVARYQTSPGNASQYASNTSATFNEHSTAITAHVSHRLTPTSEYDVFAVYFHDRHGRNVTRYVVTDVANGSYTAARMVTPAAFDARNRSVDYQVSLDWFAARHAATELHAYVTGPVAANESLSPARQAELVSTYGDGVRSPLWGRPLQANADSDTAGDSGGVF
jgi:hypothetical protein